MKKIFLFFCTVLFVFVTVSCASAEGDPFAVFEGNFRAEISLDCEGNECTLEYGREDVCIKFISPDELSGYRLRLDGDKAYLSFEDTEVQVSSHAGRVAFLLDAVFAAERENITKISAQNEKDVTVTEVKTDSFTYCFASDGTPISVSGEFDGITFKMTFLSFTGAMK